MAIQFTLQQFTSDVSGTYGYSWAPDLPGQYKITATFAGDDSYGSSWAETYATVSSPSNNTPNPTSQPITSSPPTEMYFAISTIAVIIAIIAVGTILALMLKRRP